MNEQKNRDLVSIQATIASDPTLSGFAATVAYALKHFVRLTENLFPETKNYDKAAILGLMLENVLSQGRYDSYGELSFSEEVDLQFGEQGLAHLEVLPVCDPPRLYAALDDLRKIGFVDVSKGGNAARLTPKGMAHVLLTAFRLEVADAYEQEQELRTLARAAGSAVLPLGDLKPM